MRTQVSNSITAFRMELNRVRPQDQVAMIKRLVDQHVQQTQTRLCFIWTGRYWSSNPRDFTPYFFTSEILVTSCIGSVMIKHDKEHMCLSWCQVHHRNPIFLEDLTHNIAERCNSDPNPQRKGNDQRRRVQKIK